MSDRMKLWRAPAMALMLMGLGALQASGAYLAGAQLTLADVAVGLATHRWFMTPIDPRPDLPAVQAYYERLSERPGFRAHGRNGMP